jgi:hypothetical protein
MIFAYFQVLNCIVTETIVNNFHGWCPVTILLLLWVVCDTVSLQLQERNRVD